MNRLAGSNPAPSASYKGRTAVFKRAWLIITLIGGFAALECVQAQAQTCSVSGPPCVYSVKFICGDESANPNLHPPSEPPLKPGNYATSINIHNFHLDQTATFSKTAIIAPTELDFDKNPGQLQMSKPVSITLRPGQAFEIDCTDIVALFQPQTAPLGSSSRVSWTCGVLYRC